MTPQELRTERRQRAYGDGAPHRERNGTPTTSERIEQVRMASEIDEAIAAEHPGLFGDGDQALQLRRRQLELERLRG